MHPASRFAVGAAVACALCLFAREALAPAHPTVPLASATGASARVARDSCPHPYPNTRELPAVPDAPASPDASLARRCLILAERDPLAAVEMALDQNLCAADPGLFASLLLQWARQDFTAAHEWTLRQESGDWRDDQLARLGYLLAQSDPAAAARVVTRDIPPGPRQDEAVLSVLHQWVVRAPDQARAWADTFAEGPLRRRAAAELEGRGLADL